jgi:hypothetical protein
MGEHAALYLGEQRRIGVEPVEVAVEGEGGAAGSRAAICSIASSASRLPYSPPITYSVSLAMSGVRANTRGE